MSNEILKQDNNDIRQYGALMPQTIDGKIKLAGIFAQSGLMPSNVKTVQQVFVSLYWGHELGLLPMTAITNINVVNGRPVLSTDISHALVRNNPEYAGCEWKRQDSEAAHTVITRKSKNGITEKFIGYFDIEMAKRAGLLNKDNWRHYPERMLKKRALSFALRDAFPDVLAGIYDPDEIDSNPIDITPIASETIYSETTINNNATDNNNSPVTVKENKAESNNLSVDNNSSVFEDAYKNGEILDRHIEWVRSEYQKGNTVDLSYLAKMQEVKLALDKWITAHKRGFIFDEQLTEAKEKPVISRINGEQLEMLIEKNGYSIEDYRNGIDSNANRAVDDNPLIDKDTRGKMSLGSLEDEAKNNDFNKPSSKKDSKKKSNTNTNPSSDEVLNFTEDNSLPKGVLL